MLGATRPLGHDLAPSRSGIRYAVTGSLAVSGIAPVAAARLLVVYVDIVDDAVPALELRITERRANVMLIEPEDDGVYEGSTLKDGLRVVAVSQAAADLVRGVRPRVCFFGHHTRLDSQSDGVPCVGLNKVRMPGNLVAVEVPERGRDWTVLGEWPERRPQAGKVES